MCKMIRYALTLIALLSALQMSAQQHPKNVLGFPDDSVELRMLVIDTVSSSPSFGRVIYVDSAYVAKALGLDGFTTAGWQGSIRESVAGDIISDGVTAKAFFEQRLSGDLTCIFSEGDYIWDTSPADTVNLVIGTDEIPKFNYVYFDHTADTLAVSTVSFPNTEHARLMTVVVQSASSILIHTPYKTQMWTDHLASENEQGHIVHLNDWIRHQPATYVSGVAPTFTITAGAPDSLGFITSAGVVKQLHDQNFESSDSTNIFVVNDFASNFLNVRDLADLLTDALGNSMSAKYFSLVIWGSANADSVSSHLFLNLPSGSYNTEALLEADGQMYANYTIPKDFKSTGFLISELKLRHQSAGGGSWTLIEHIDLRGLTASTSIGGGAGVGDDWGAQVIISDATGGGDGTIASEFKVDTSLISTINYVDQQVTNGSGVNFYEDMSLLQFTKHLNFKSGLIGTNDVDTVDVNVDTTLIATQNYVDQNDENTNIGNTDLTLTGDRDLILDGNDLYFKTGIGADLIAIPESFNFIFDGSAMNYFSYDNTRFLSVGYLSAAFTDTLGYIGASVGEDFLLYSGTIAEDRNYIRIQDDKTIHGDSVITMPNILNAPTDNLMAIDGVGRLSYMNWNDVNDSISDYVVNSIGFSFITDVLNLERHDINGIGADLSDMSISLSHLADGLFGDKDGETFVTSIAKMKAATGLTLTGVIAPFNIKAELATDPFDFQVLSVQDFAAENTLAFSVNGEGQSIGAGDTWIVSTGDSLLIGMDGDGYSDAGIVIDTGIVSINKDTINLPNIPVTINDTIVVYNEAKGQLTKMPFISTDANNDVTQGSDGGVYLNIPIYFEKSITLEAPTDADNITLWHTDESITVTQINDVCIGSTPSVTWNIEFASTRSEGSPSKLWISDRVTTSESGAETTSFDDATIPADSWIWLTTSATSGTVESFSATTTYEHTVISFDKSITLETPTAIEDVTMWYADEAITFIQVNDVCVGSTPSVTWNIEFSSTRNDGTPSKLWSTDRVTTSESGAETTSFDDATVPAGNWIWLTTSATSGTVTNFNMTAKYEKD